MDKVLKRRLIGASILIALAVIFVPMLLVDPDSVRDGAGDAIDMPPMPDSAREVRRIPLDPEAARVSEPDRASTGRGDGQASSPGSEPAESAPASDRVSPDERIVLRPDLVEPEPSPSADASAADDPGSRPESGADSAADQAESADVSGPTESESETEAQAQPAPEPVETTEPAQMSTGDWVVQVASFGSQDAAEQVRARLEALGHIVSSDDVSQGLPVVRRPIRRWRRSARPWRASNRSSGKSMQTCNKACRLVSALQFRLAASSAKKTPKAKPRAWPASASNRSGSASELASG